MKLHRVTMNRSLPCWCISYVLASSRANSLPLNSRSARKHVASFPNGYGHVSVPVACVWPSVWCLQLHLRPNHRRPLGSPPCKKQAQQVIDKFLVSRVNEGVSQYNWILTMCARSRFPSDTPLDHHHQPLCRLSQQFITNFTRKYKIVAQTMSNRL